jgi:hypothetical protein
MAILLYQKFTSYVDKKGPFMIYNKKEKRCLAGQKGAKKVTLEGTC